MKTLFLSVLFCQSFAFAQGPLEGTELGVGREEFCSSDPATGAVQLSCRHYLTAPTEAVPEDRPPDLHRHNRWYTTTDHVHLSFSPAELSERGIEVELICDMIRNARFKTSLPCPRSRDLLVWWDNENAKEAFCQARMIYVTHRMLAFGSSCKEKPPPGPPTGPILNNR